MFVNFGILCCLTIVTVQCFYYDQYKVFRIEKDLKIQDSNDDHEDAQIYFQAIKDTFDLYYRDVRYKDGKVCQSDQTHLDIGDKWTIFSKLKRNFNRSCSYIIGNVVIAHISDEDISFLDSIKEISGYLFIFNNTAKSIVLKNLQVIRGENALLLKGGKFSLAIAGNYFGSKKLEYLILPNLQVILRHDVLILESPGLCYMNMISWDSLIEEPQKVLISETNEESCLVNYNTSGKQFCHPDCPKWSGKQFCWSNNSSSCQIINNCRSQNCSYVSKCYMNLNYKAEDCCNDQCAGGCSGPSNKQCLACKNFNNDGFCVEYCPRQIIHKNFKQIKNPDGKLAFNNLCVDKCPVKFFNDHGNCVLNCTTPNTYPVNETCAECPNGVCPKVCHMKDVVENKDIFFLNRLMLNRLENCTVYDGNIVINMLSFEGDPYFNMSRKDHGVRLQDLKKLETLQEIYGYLDVHTGTFGNFKSLLFLKNLKIIRANNIASNKRYGLSITNNFNLRFLGLKNLLAVQNGDIIIRGNRFLCWSHTLNNQSIKHTGQMIITENARCGNCSNQCNTKYGCWGPSSGLCVRCLNYLAKKISCIPDCSVAKGFFYQNAPLTEKLERQCSNCHPQCKEKENTCMGPMADQCNHGCKKYSHNGYCIEKCPSSYFGNFSNCVPCHFTCTEMSTQSCSGSGSYIGDGGCHKCNHVILNVQKSNLDSNTLTCVNSSMSCPKGFFKLYTDFRTQDYFKKLPKYLERKTFIKSLLKTWFYNKTDHKNGFGSICLPCNPLCSECTDGSNWFCPTCKFFKLEDKCVEECPSEHFHYFPKSVKTNGLCIRCHEECDGKCYGQTEYNCVDCRNVKIFINESNNDFFCNNTCGKLFQVVIKSEIICVEKWRADQLSRSWIYIITIVLVSSFLMFCGLAVLICFLVNLQKKSKYDKKHIKLDEFYNLQTETLMTVQPNMATLLLITESQLSRGDIIGSGAFGVVYKAIWQPNLDKIEKSNSFLRKNLARYSRDSTIKLLVAVKVLTDISDPTNNMQLLEEAKVMASVDHPCCLRILGVCLTAHPQLITQFMPLGCLLEFCQKHRSSINNYTFLNWAKQIACGMEYLESKGIIHCDLAARNVLLQSPKQVKITDFGLAKILDQSQHQYQSKGGRMPIKWLAIESIKHRVFSSRSDVWSFGVTLWEMLTFGEKPFQNIKAVDILNQLEKGQRLPHPKICSIDVYATMVQCWMIEAESRPSFSELTKIFEAMSRNPNRFLLIQNSSEINSFYSRLEDDALKYDEFLQALVSVPQLNPDYDSLDKNSVDVKNIRSVKMRYKEMCSIKNTFVNYVHEWEDNSHSCNTDCIPMITEDEAYDESLNTWSEYSRESKRLSNSTLVTTVNNNSDYISINREQIRDFSDDGYLLPNKNKISSSKMIYPTLNAISESNNKVVFSCANSEEKELFMGHESSL